MPGYLHSPRITEVERSLPGLTFLADHAGLGHEMRSLVEMMDRRDRDLEHRHLNPPSCRIYSTVGQVVGTATTSQIVFDGTRWDSTNGSMWQSASPSNLTAVVDGVYHALFHYYMDTAGATYAYIIKYVAATAAYVTYAANSSNLGSVNTDIDMKAGDAATFWVRHNDGVNRNVLVAASYSPEASLTWMRPGV